MFQSEDSIIVEVVDKICVERLMLGKQEVHRKPIGFLLSY